MDYKSLREHMVERQLMPRNITDDKVLTAFRKVERHNFVTEKLRDAAYGDHPLPVGDGQTISQPYMVALMTQALALEGNENVLEIGTGSGYQTAILAEIAKNVYSVERFESLANTARSTLQCFGYNNVEIRIGDGTLGWEEHAPYDRIIVTAGSPRVPLSLVTQLKDGGRMIIPVGGHSSQALTSVEKRNGRIVSKDLCGCVFVPLIGKEGWDS